MVRGVPIQVGQDEREHPAAGGADRPEKTGNRGPAGAAGAAEFPQHPEAPTARRVRWNSGNPGELAAGKWEWLGRGAEGGKTQFWWS